MMVRKTHIHLVCWLWLGSWCANSVAYAPKSGHVPLSQAALAKVAMCHWPELAIQPERWQARFIQGNMAMDEGLGLALGDQWSLAAPELFRWSTRRHHWHFFRPDLPNGAQVGATHLSMAYLWQGLQQALAQPQPPLDAWLYLGGLAHLLEDVSVPAHVIPVYHGPAAVRFVEQGQFAEFVPDHLSFWQFVDDPVDQLPVQSPPPSATNCDQVFARTPDELRQQLALDTLQALQQPIPQCPGFRWQAFYQTPQPGHYFGRYAQSPPLLFNHAAQWAHANGERCQLQADDTRYRAFVQQRHQQAVQATFELMGWYLRGRK